MRGPTIDSVARPRIVAVAAIVLFATVLTPDGAGAQPNRGAVQSTETVTSGTWGASASPTAWTWTSGGASRQTTVVTSTGSIALTQVTYQVTISAGPGATTFTLEACARPWNGGGHCPSGGATSIGGTYAIGSITTVGSSFVPALGGVIYLQATASGAVTTTITMTLQLSVTSPSQLRAGIITSQ